MIIDFRIIGTGKNFFVGGLEAMPPFMDRYRSLYDFNRLCNLPFEEFLINMEKSGISLAVLHAEYSYGDIHMLNRKVGETVKKYPKKLIGFASVDPSESKDIVSDLKRYIEEWGMKGLNLQTWVQGWYANDKRLYPLYEYCQQKDIPVAMHTSINFSTNRKIGYSRPLYIDEIACDFPKLTIIANHAGWPWVNEMVAVAWKHPNVFIETGGVSPKYISRPGTGWEMLLTYGNSILQDQILFASDSLIPHQRIVKELDMLPFKDHVKEKYLYRNAMRVLKLTSI
jgi:predicted TIM-barrel fold metal-dependent hydrolase